DLWHCRFPGRGEDRIAHWSRVGQPVQPLTARRTVVEMRKFSNLEIIKLAADTEVSPSTSRKWPRGARVIPSTHNALVCAILNRGYATATEIAHHTQLVFGGGK